jgi:TolB-like protein
MRLLVCLAEHAGEVVSIEDLLNHVWSDVTVAPDSVYQAVTSLRRVLGDDPKQPTYIETVPRLGYRMVAPVSPWVDQSNGKMDFLGASDNGHPAAAPNDAPARGPRRRRGLLWAAGVAVGFAFLVVFLFYGRLANNKQAAAPKIVPPPPKSIAVLPFLDLTDEMSEEPFADGITEELIDKLSKIPDLRVPPPTSSFYFKGKLWPRSHGTPQVTIADVAKTLGVTYVLDGSVRKSGGRLRVDARLILADKGYVVWSEIYDRPFNDILMVQDDIAGEVTKALRASIEAKPDH